MRPLSARENMTHSITHHENEHQQSVNDFWCCILVYQSLMWLVGSIYEVLTIFISFKCLRILSCYFVNELRCYCPGGWCGNIAWLSANKGCQLLVYRCQQSSAIWIIQNARPKIIDALLTLICKMGHGACCFHFCLWRWPILWLCITMTKSLVNYLTEKTKNHWHSIDAHCTTRIFALCKHCIWYSISLMMFS